MLEYEKVNRENVKVTRDYRYITDMNHNIFVINYNYNLWFLNVSSIKNSPTDR